VERAREGKKRLVYIPFVRRNCFVNLYVNSIRMLCGRCSGLEEAYDDVVVAEAEDGLRPVPRKAGQLVKEGELDAILVVRVSPLRMVRLVCTITARPSTYMRPSCSFVVRPCRLILDAIFISFPLFQLCFTDW
jgi:hypothetical protein